MDLSRPTLLLFVAAGALALGHSILPDHWLPFAVVARTNRWSILRTARASSLAAVGHVVASALLGAVIVAIGVQFRGIVERQQSRVVGTILILTGLAFLIWTLARRDGHDHGHRHDHDHGHPHSHAGHRHDEAGTDYAHGAATDPRAREEAASPMRRFAVLAVLGAAATPDLTILPVFLAASAVGAAEAVGVLIFYALVSVATFVGFTVVATLGGYQVQWPWLERYGDQITAALLIVIGLLVITEIL